MCGQQIGILNGSTVFTVILRNTTLVHYINNLLLIYSAH